MKTKLVEIHGISPEFNDKIVSFSRTMPNFTEDVMAVKS